MRLRRLRRDCRSRIRHLSIQSPFDVRVFCADLARQRGRPLHLQPISGLTSPGAPSGLWLATDTADHIFYEQDTSPLHHDHIILHEVGHMLCEHNQLALDDVRTAFRAIGSVDPARIRSILPRIRYNQDEEQQAEMIATLILEDIGRIPAPSPLTGFIAGLEAGIGYHRSAE
ncbi:hypothetical protein LX15_005975 [Streptoalloteichus tenebrarius]|uniref:Regulator component n=1 Tax=Streptoalloteichus tenebrarius (strain ATCC 17920 / DSM 40477 / JCM 4838 / CBS 697.72 / NBRC 16177 / NCIMB 11028 / NRRL B-12390 / A12253. 1 / ISP 5477) TaxID=1933 RepID=A0ABT1I3E9_STRSD|nr:hypothetical protein [Streptoalloteichus tenebrarius]MCP2262241.1 hypothetical protein [Streptoalloteichus tenebrarius]BFF00780.1 hypothetical protein GCM10020241_24550 [Streptoalloteichus tenebrarius]